jgi:CRP/FNR family cyclic AMP-dependent transcriptional regulator
VGDPDVLTRLANVPLFAAIPHADLDGLANRFVGRSCPRGSLIFRQGDPGNALFLIESGAVKISTLSLDGREMVMAVLGPGEVFGELSLFDSGLRSADATALEDTTLLSLSHDVFRPYLERHPGVAVELLGVLAGRLRETGEALQDAIFSDVPARLAKRLLDLAERYGRPVDEGVVIELALTQEEIARMVGSSRESVNKAIQSFLARGWLSMSDRKYVITAPDQLRRRAS